MRAPVAVSTAAGWVAGTALEVSSTELRILVAGQLYAGDVGLVLLVDSTHGTVMEAVGIVLESTAELRATGLTKDGKPVGVSRRACRIRVEDWRPGDEHPSQRPPVH